MFENEKNEPYSENPSFGSGQESAPWVEDTSTTKKNTVSRRDEVDMLEIEVEVSREIIDIVDWYKNWIEETEVIKS